MNKNIVIIDDSCQIRELIAVGLSKEGFSVFEAESAKEGLLLISEYNPQIILIDIRLPDLNGLEVVKKIRQFNKNVKIVIISGLDSCEIENKSISVGADVFLCKNIGVEKIISSVTGVNC